MIEVLDFAAQPVNVIPTTMLAFVLLYWITVVIGVIDMDAIDVDVDVDADIDIDMDIDADVDIDADAGGGSEGSAGNSPGFMTGVLSFFNLGKVPLMLFVTFLVLPMWFISINLNHYLSNTNFLISVGLLVPNFIVCLFIAKILTTPFARFFSKINKENESVSPLGKMCVILLPVNEKKTGQAEIKVDGTTLRINVRSDKGMHLNKGDSALVVDYLESDNVYLITPYKQ